MLSIPFLTLRFRGSIAFLTMETLDAIASRRSIRRFKPDPVPEALITRCLEAARLAPSATNSQPWKFVVVRADNRREKRREAAHGQKHVGRAPVTIVVLGDRKTFRKRFRRAKELAELGAIAAEMPDDIREAYEEYERQSVPDAVITINCMIAAENLMIAAADQGLGTCLVMLFDSEKVTELLELPGSLFPVALIPTGYPNEEPPTRPRYPFEEIAFDEGLDTPWVEMH